MQNKLKIYKTDFVQYEKFFSNVIAQILSYRLFKNKFLAVDVIHVIMGFAVGFEKFRVKNKLL